MSITKYEVISFVISAVASFFLLKALLPESNFPIFQEEEKAAKSERGSNPEKVVTVRPLETKEITHSFGDVIDELNGVKVYYNGRVGTIDGRAVTPDGYNLGLKYQCVEFVKRYYYEFYNHKMPNTYGNAKDFFDPVLGDGQMNRSRGLRQFSNPSFAMPRIGDLLVFGEQPGNSFGHVAIVSEVSFNEGYVELVHQNPGRNNPSRALIPMTMKDGIYHLGENTLVGWLRRS